MILGHRITYTTSRQHGLLHLPFSLPDFSVYYSMFYSINIEVLSVVAQQILSILSALALAAQSPNPLEKTRFMFDGRMLQLVWSCGIFITMNPGYAGRTELPDNLKSMFRPIAMVVPDSSMIAEITLFAEGFSTTKVSWNSFSIFYL